MESGGEDKQNNLPAYNGGGNLSVDQPRNDSRPDSGIGSYKNSPEADRKAPLEIIVSRNDESEHRLAYSWSFWLNEWNKDWNNALSLVCDISTVEEFWRVFNNLMEPAQCSRFNFNFFKKGIRPEWEDPANGRYGRWNLVQTLPENMVCDVVWEELCLFLIGGKSLGALLAHVNGIYFSRKLNCFRASVWVSTKNKRQVMSIGKKIQEALWRHVQFHYSLQFSLHKSKSKRVLYTLN